MVQMPALNTPQFNWCKSNLKVKPQPVPPIYQPQVAADAIYFASFNKRREYYVGYNTAIIIFGNKLFPWLGDRYLAKTGFKSQMTNEKIPADRPDNLFEPVEGDYAANGDFNDQAKSKSLQFQVSKYRNTILYALTAILFLLLLIAIF